MIWERMKDRPAWSRIIKGDFCDRRGDLLNLTENYKVDAYNNNKRANSYAMLKKGRYEKDNQQNTFEISAKKKIK